MGSEITSPGRCNYLVSRTLLHHDLAEAIAIPANLVAPD